MISLDWKERLKKDAIDFVENKIPQKYYDIDVIYNIYPERIDNKVPSIIVTFVAKILASKMAKNAEKYFDFYDYIIKNKDSEGIIVFGYIMAKAVMKKPEIFFDYIHKVLQEIKNKKDCNFIMDKAILPLLKKMPEIYPFKLLSWVSSDNDLLVEAVSRIIIKFISANPEYIKPIFKKTETSWLYATPQMIKFNIEFIKAIANMDKEFYFSIYKNYKSTRNLIFAEILHGAMKLYHPVMEEIANNWAKSGNVKLKKIGKSSQKIVKKLKK